MKSEKIHFRAKKAFTLLEVVISVTIFMIMLIFIYKVLDDTKISNKKFEEHIYKSEDINNLYKIFIEDIAESKSNIILENDKDKNSIVTFESNNTYNNSFYKNITYLVSSNNHLVRIESKNPFKKELPTVEFFNNSYIDVLMKDIKKFIILPKDNKYVFIIELKNGEKIMFPTYKLNEIDSSTTGKK